MDEKCVAMHNIEAVVRKRKLVGGCNLEGDFLRTTSRFCLLESFFDHFSTEVHANNATQRRILGEIASNSARTTSYIKNATCRIYIR